MPCRAVVDVEATAPIRQAEVGAVRDMLVRARGRFNLHPVMLAADTAYGAADMLGWLVKEQNIEPHIPVFHSPAVDCGAIDERGQVRAQGWRVSSHRLHP